MKILSQTAQDTCSTGFTPRKRHEESEVRHCLCEVWHHLVKTRVNSLKCHTPWGKRQIHHTSDWANNQKLQYHWWTQDRAENAHHTLTVSGCTGLVTASREFFEAENRTFCVLSNQPSGSALHRKTTWHSTHLDYLPVPFRTALQNVTCSSSLDLSSSRRWVRMWLSCGQQQRVDWSICR
jgi:hypothetical protein